MNLWFRVLWLFVTAPFRGRLTPPFEASSIRFRVWPFDLDTNLHMNNGRYLTIADLGRADLLVRSNLWRAVLKKGWLPMLSGGIVRWRRELKPFQPFELRTRVVFWNSRNIVMEHQFIINDGDKETVAAVALVRGGLYNRREGKFIDSAAIFREVGYDGPSPEATPEVAAFMAAEDELKLSLVA